MATRSIPTRVHPWLTRAAEKESPANRVRAEGQYVVIAVYRQPDGEVRYVIRRQDDPSHEYTAEAQELRTRSRLRSS